MVYVLQSAALYVRTEPSHGILFKIRYHKYSGKYITANILQIKSLRVLEESYEFHTGFDFDLDSCRFICSQLMYNISL